MGNNIVEHTLNKVVFLDRDGTLNEEVNYLHKPEDMKLLPGVPQALKKLKDAGYKLIVVTNQAGVARGYYTEEDVKILHQYMNQLLEKEGAEIDAFYYCPHHPVHGIGAYKKVCNCRKPGTGMFEMAEKDFPVDRAASYMIGTRTYIDGNGLHANGQKITDVAPGALNESSMDAVNGAQLYQTNQRMNLWNRDLSRVGAGAAALAGLHPVGYDETAKLSFAVGFGSYKSEHAAALGAYYRPNDNVLFGISSTVGYGDNMYNASLSFKFGQGSHERGISKAAQQKIDTLQNRVDILESRLNSLLSMFNPNMAKDFPDVPENHWAYEAISRLAGNGIIEGYPDGEYHGERTMTRYEMATIIYNALKRGVQADANLVREFQPELSMIESSR